MAKRNEQFPKPTLEEEIALGKFLWMLDWHFNLIKQGCLLIGDYGLTFCRSKEQYICANIYGLKAINPNTGEKCIANFFIRIYNRVYQCNTLVEVGKLLELLAKDAKYDEHMEYRDDRLYRIRQKRKAKKKREARIASQISNSAQSSA